MRILHLDASPRASRSRSRTVADRFFAGLPPEHRVTRHDLWAMKLPSLEGGMIEGRYDLIMGNPLPGDLAAQWAKVRRIADNFLDHDAIVISTPMWNFGVPYKLKHFIDIVTQPGMTFRNDAAGNVEGLAAGKRALIIAASAMPFGKDEAIAQFDFQARYIEAWLGFIGVQDIATVRVAPTFGSENEVNETMRIAGAQAERVAKRWLAA